MCQDEHATALAAFINTTGLTRCPTACAFPTQGTVAAADRAALADYAAARQCLRERRAAARRQIFSSCAMPAPAE